MNNPNCGACGMLNSRGFCSLTACRFPVVNELGTWQERILANKPKQTNADRIRAMNDEALAEWLTMVEVRIIERNPMLERPALKADWREWLKQEVDT